jgi:hypothetical protein
LVDVEADQYLLPGCDLNPGRRPISVDEILSLVMMIYSMDELAGRT